MIMVRPVAARRARPTIADAAEVVSCLLKTVIARRNTFRKHCTIWEDVIDGPMVPGASGRVGIVARQSYERYWERRSKAKGGDRSWPSQVKRRGIIAPSANAEDVRRIDDCIGPPGQPSTSISLTSN